MRHPHGDDGGTSWRIFQPVVSLHDAAKPFALVGLYVEGHKIGLVLGKPGIQLAQKHIANS